MSSIYHFFAKKTISPADLCQDPLVLKYWSDAGYADKVNKWLESLEV